MSPPVSAVLAAALPAVVGLLAGEMLAVPGLIGLVVGVLAIGLGGVRWSV